MIKYEFYYSDGNTNNHCWWDNNSENRPGPDYFNGYSMVELPNDTQFNYIDFFNATVNIKFTFSTQLPDNTTLWGRSFLVKYRDVDKPQYINERYYFVKSVTNETNLTVTLHLILDIWRTYGIDLFMFNTKIQTVRNMFFTRETLYFNDELLDSVALSYLGSKETRNYYLYPTQSDADGNFITYRGGIPSNYNVKYNVYNPPFGSKNNKWFIFKNIPGATSNTQSTFYAIPAIGTIDVKTIPPAPAPSKKTYCNHDENMLNQISYLSEWAPYFMGIFILPNAAAFTNVPNAYGIVHANTPNGGTDVMVFMFSPSTDYSAWHSAVKFIKLPWEPIAALKLNDTKIINPAIFKYFKINIAAITPNMPFYMFMREDGWIAPLPATTSNNLTWTFFFTLGGSVIEMGNPHFSNSENLATMPYDLPSGSNEYGVYYASVKNQINTGIQQANDKALMSGAQSIINGLISGASGAASGIISGNPAAALGAIAGASSNIAFGVGNSVIGNIHYKQNVNSKLSDVKAISGAKINPSTSAAIAFEFNTHQEFLPPISPKETSWYIPPNDNSLQRLNNIAFLYGCVNPKFDNIDNFLIYKNFNYISIDDAWLGTYIDTIFYYLPKDVISTIKDNLSGGLRIWNVVPNFEVENALK